MTDVMAKVQQVKYQIPQEANDPVILKSTGDTTAVMYMGFSSRSCRPRDHRLPDPRCPAPAGHRARRGAGRDPRRPALRDADLARPRPAGRARAVGGGGGGAIRANNFQSAPGQAKGNFTVVDIVADTGLTDLEDFRDMVVKAANGGLVRLRDVSTIELGAQSSNSSVSMNGQQAVFIGVNSTPTGNPLNIVAGVRELMPTIERGLPPTVTPRSSTIRPGSSSPRSTRSPAR